MSETTSVVENPSDVATPDSTVPQPIWKTVKKEATVTKAYGNTLPKPISFEYDVKLLADDSPIPEEFSPTQDDLRQLANTKLNAKARAAKQVEVLEANNIFAPKLENNPDMQLKQMVKLMMLSGKYESEAQATTIAKGVLGQS